MKKSTYYKKHHNKKYSIKLICLYICIPIFIIFVLLKNFNTKSDLDIPIYNVCSFKISSSSIIKLNEIAKNYNLDFPQLLTYYAIENNFFNEKSLEIDDIEKNFILNYETVKNKYKNKQIEPYLNIINNILTEIKTFPIPKDLKNDYTYSDSYGAERTYGGKRIHTGTDIMSKENVAGKIPIVSMTDGIVENIGWNERGGYRVGIRTKNGNYYYYAHLDTFSPNLEKGKQILSGENLGFMGNTGYSKTEGTKGNFEVHLHIGIQINSNLSNDELWINPYPFLSLIENIDKEK